MIQRVAFGEVKPEFADAHVHDVHAARVDRVDAAAHRHRALGIFPNLLFRITDAAVDNALRALGG